MNIPECQKLVAIKIDDQQKEDLLRFHETTEDDQGYDVPKDRMKKLARIGLVRSLGFSRYEFTDVGDSMIEALSKPQPAAHLTIPGALEWDGDNGTHGVVGTHSADGEHSESSAAIATLKALGYTHNGGTHWKPPVGQKPDFDLIDSLRAQLDNTEQSRRSFFDLSQDLEKRLAAAEQRKTELIELLNGYPRGVPGFAAWADKVTAAIKPAGTGASVAKVCIECDQPYCHGVCVERGDQDYDRDQAAKGGDDE